MHTRDLERSDGPEPRRHGPAPDHDTAARRPAAGGIAPIDGRAVAYLQRTAGNCAVNGLVALQRQPPADPAKPATTTSPLVYVVVRDRNLDAGGGAYADDLEQAKQIFMRNSNPQPWTLVLSIHGSEERLGAQAPPNWQDKAKFYESAQIDSLFNKDPDYVKWRTQFGPTHIVLNACQINIGFERTIIDNITRSGGTGGQTRQSAKGLGTGCKPLTTTQTLTYTHEQLKFKDTPIKTRAQWDKIPADDRASLEQDLVNLNNEFGYFGQPPVPNDQVVRYYFDVTPLGGWPLVEVGVGHDQVQPTGIPFWNRSTGPKRAEFNRLCERGIGKLPDRTPSAPPAPRE